MGDFFVDFRPASCRSARPADQLRFSSHTRAFILDEPTFGLVVTSTDDPLLWAPFKSQVDGAFVAVAGRVALDDKVWEAGESVGGNGGLAARAIYELYRREGVHWMEQIGGNCAVLLYDAKQAEFQLVTDRCGVFPAFEFLSGDSLLYCSHPDVLAEAAGERDCLDEVSMSEFVLTSTVTPPFTYYQRIRALEPGAVATVSLKEGGLPTRKIRRYFQLNYQPDKGRDEDDLAEELAGALRKAVRRRTLRRFGRTAVALSGGLDSRAILACIENKDLAFAFCCFDEPNRELRIAKEIARALEVPFVQWRRDFEYYGDNAEMGVRISGGMGSLANNHFLGIVERLRSEGAQNLLTGCYCDYLFKGLPLNRRAHWLTGREELAPFRHQFYFSHRLRPTPLARQARERWESRVPLEFQAQASESDVFEVEARRTFPLCYEGDNQQRVVPQRVSGWYLPVADRDVLHVYRKLPYHYKLNRSVFLKAVLLLCDGRVAAIPDANTGACPGASATARFLSTNWLALKRKAATGLRRTLSSDGSWPDWHHYVGHSRKLEELWKRPNDDAFGFFERVLGDGGARREMAAYQGRDVFLLVSLLTMKLWLEQRV